MTLSNGSDGVFHNEVGGPLGRNRKAQKIQQAMMTLQGMADHRFTSVSLFTNVFLGEIIFFPLNFFPLIFVFLVKFLKFEPKEYSNHNS